MAKLNILVDDNYYNDVRSILKVKNIDIDDYLCNIIDNEMKNILKNNISKNELKENKAIISKSKAIGLVRNNGYKIGDVVTFASKNKGAAFYWANPNIDVLTVDYTLILNDQNNNLLHVFYIPKNSLNINDIKVRHDRQWQIDFQISFDVNTFRDTRSDVYLINYKIGEIKY